MKFKSIFLAASVLAGPAALANMAEAQPVTGPYVNLEGGTTILNSVNFNESLTGVGGKAFFKESYAGVGGVGYGFGNGLRIQADGNYFHNTASKVDTPYGDAGIFGYHNQYGPMLNVLYDIPVGLPVFPYVGGGVGYQFVQYDLHTGPFTFSGTKGTFAFDVIAGLSYPISFVPGLSLTAEYRFMMLPATRNYGDSITGGFPPGNPNGGTIKVGQEFTNTILGGLRYQLFQPPAPPPPPAPAPVAAPAPAPAKTYLVFFDWDKYKLTPRATQIIAQAASDSKTQSTTTIMVNGYTDTSGTAVYNQGLSVRRAKAVEAQLVTDGVPESEITAQGFGDTHLLVPTGPGVREPQNRRVEIVLQ